MTLKWCARLCMAPRRPMCPRRNGGDGSDSGDGNDGDDDGGDGDGSDGATAATTATTTATATMTVTVAAMVTAATTAMTAALQRTRRQHQRLTFPPLSASFRARLLDEHRDGIVDVSACSSERCASARAVEPHCDELLDVRLVRRCATVACTAAACRAAACCAAACDRARAARRGAPACARPFRRRSALTGAAPPPRRFNEREYRPREETRQGAREAERQERR
jgi:hypothetical protein